MSIDMSTTAIVFLFLGLVLALIFRVLKNKAIRKKASYRLYSVRDDLICLVAEGKLDDHSPIFEYYYERINMLLKTAPKVGLDDAMNGFLYLNNDSDFEYSLGEAKRRAEEMFDLVKNEDAEVGEVVSKYYSAASHMMLTHSSIARMFYIAFLKAPWMKFAKKIIPEEIRKIIRTVKFADDEASQFKGNEHHCV